jgi:hypothetical protein
VFIESLPSNGKEDRHRDVVEMGSDTMMNIPSFILIGSDIQKLVGTWYGHADNKVIW